MKSLSDRLNKLSGVLAHPSVRGGVVIYDAETGAPLTPVPAIPVTLWIPDNGRGDRIQPAAVHLPADVRREDSNGTL